MLREKLRGPRPRWVRFARFIIAPAPPSCSFGTRNARAYLLRRAARQWTPARSARRRTRAGRSFAAKIFFFVARRAARGAAAATHLVSPDSPARGRHRQKSAEPAQRRAAQAGRRQHPLPGHAVPAG